MNRNILFALAAVLILGCLIFTASHWQAKLAAGLPPRKECADADDAKQKADAWARAHGGYVLPVLGTGSMAPFIPAAAANLDPKHTFVAFIVADPAKRFGDVQTGALVAYLAAWDGTLCVLHQAAEQDGDGWIMTGLHNAGYENRWRVTRANFVAIAASVFTWKQ